MISERLKSLRLENGYRQKDIIEALELSSARYSQYESGKRMPDIALLIKMADFFDVTVDYLVGRTDYKNLHSVKDAAEGVTYEIVGDKLSREELAEIRKIINENKK